MTVTEIEDYYWTMAARHRLVTILGGGSVAALCTFFVMPDLAQETVQRYYDRRCWSLPSDQEDGTVIYIDKLLSYIPLTPQLFHAVEDAITEQVPQWEMAVWYRPGHGDLPDRRYTLRRRWPDVSDVHG